MNDSSHAQQDALHTGRKGAGGAILFSEMRPEAAWEDEFNAWYDTEHIPVRMAAPGFIGARRYRATESDDYLVVYEMASMAALATAAITPLAVIGIALERYLIMGMTAGSVK